MDRLCADVQSLVQAEELRQTPRREVFARIWQVAHGGDLPEGACSATDTPPPQLSEAWYCCAEPTAEQLAGL
jgi:hypothetical protein